MSKHTKSQKKHKVTQSETREQWMIGVALAGVVNAANAPFCSFGDDHVEEVNRDPNYIENVARVVARGSSRMNVEDAITILETALKYLQSPDDM